MKAKITDSFPIFGEHGDECPVCGSQIMALGFKHGICGSCAKDYIERIRKCLVLLTDGEIKVLRRMENEEELVQSIPGGWYIDSDRVHGRIGWSLLRKVLISEVESGNEKFIRYYINEWGKNSLKIYNLIHQDRHTAESEDHRETK